MRSVTEFSDLTAEIREFAESRDWSQFHTVRNLVLAIAGEVGELAAEVQWISTIELADALSEPSKRLAFEAELADVAIYVLRLADVLGTDLSQVIRAKLRVNEERYPVEKSRGNALKYTELGD